MQFKKIVCAKNESKAPGSRQKMAEEVIRMEETMVIMEQYYSEYENGNRSIPIFHLMKLAKFYNVSIDYIVGLTDNIKPYSRKIS